jgi:hypothetical protein
VVAGGQLAHRKSLSGNHRVCCDNLKRVDWWRSVRKAGYQTMITEWQPILPFVIMYQQNWMTALTPKVKSFFTGPSPEMTQYAVIGKD